MSASPALAPVPPQPQTAVEDAARRLAEAQQAQAAQELARQAAQTAAEAGQAVPPPPAAPTAPQGSPETPPPRMGVPDAVFVPGMGYVQPMTRSQVRALEQRSERLSEQLKSVEGRRDELVEQLEQSTDPAVRAGLEPRIQFLDQRLLSLEREIAETSAQRASMAARLGAQTSEPSSPPSNSSSSDWPGVVALFTLTPIALAYARNLWRRGRAPAAAAVSPQAEARFAQLEQAIDTVAVEIERVAEGQRFVTKLLREGQSVPDFTARRAGEGVESRAGGGEPLRASTPVGETGR
jgi:hypothetical protein